MKKKSTKKKAGKKAAKKKSAKKKAARKVAAKGSRRVYNVTATKPITLKPRNHFKRGDKRKKVSRPDVDTVQWVNTTGRGRDIDFLLWPFTGNPRRIHVDANDVSTVLTVDPGKFPGLNNVECRYTVLPKLDGPPDGPAVIVNGG
jgi:hypothetical protein